MSATPRKLADIDTPAAVIDLDLVRRNIHTMQSHLDGTPVHVRPHVKHHKTPGIASCRSRPARPASPAPRSARPRPWWKVGSATC